MRTRTKGDLILWLIAVSIVFGAMGWLSQWAASVALDRARMNRSGPAAESFRPSSVLHVGDAVVIRGTWKGRAFLAGVGSWNDMLDAQNARSMHLIARLIRRGEVVSIADGTPAIVVKTSALSCLVEVTDGPSIGQEGWIQREYIVRSR